jgi:hypothetical protein
VVDLERRHVKLRQRLARQRRIDVLLGRRREREERGWPAFSAAQCRSAKSSCSSCFTVMPRTGRTLKRTSASALLGYALGSVSVRRICTADAASLSPSVDSITSRTCTSPSPVSASRSYASP